MLVALAPDLDTPTRLRAFKAEHALPESWRLLCGSASATAAVLALLDVHVMRGEGHVVHDAKIGIFDARGALVQRLGDDELGTELGSVR